MKFNPDFCNDRYQKFNTYELALKSDALSLSELNLAYSSDAAVDLLTAWLLNLSIYAQVSVDLPIVKDIAKELYREVRSFNIAELTLFFSKIKRGHYGTFYGRLDGMLICSAAREYRNERGNILRKL